jgi:hypothetical protein
MAGDLDHWSHFQGGRKQSAVAACGYPAAKGALIDRQEPGAGPMVSSCGHYSDAPIARLTSACQPRGGIDVGEVTMRAGLLRDAPWRK